MSNSLFTFKWEGAKLLPSVCLLFGACFLWFLNPPTGLSLNAWHLFVIFIITIVGLILKPLPMGAMTLLAATMCVVTKTLPLNQILISFSSSIVWLIVSAFLLAKGFIKTGLGARIAYYFLIMFGRSTLGVSYALIVTELFFSPATPSNTARGAGIVLPIVKGLSLEYGSRPEEGTQKKIGSYLIKLLYQVNVITSAMFVTATAGNPLIVTIVAGHGVALSWSTWAVACGVPGLINLFLLPLFLYVVYPPELKRTPEAPIFAKRKLVELGAMKITEVFMAIIFVGLLCLWVFGTRIEMDATTAGLLGLCTLLITGVLDWSDIIQEKDAWDTFIWMAILIMLSSKLAQVGVTDWFGNFVKNLVAGLGWVYVLIIIGLLYYYAHYFFASMTAHISALFATFYVACIASGAPPMVTALLLGAASSLSAGLTHYGTGTAPAYFRANYLSLGEWWRVGFFVSVLNIVVWGVVGSCWWSILGYL